MTSDWERQRQRIAKLKPDGQSRIDVHCRRCSRRWLRLNGSEEGLHQRGLFYAWADSSPSITERMQGAKTRFYNPWTGRVSDLRPQIMIQEFAGEVIGETLLLGKIAVPKYSSKRYRITCHKRCGRVEVFSLETLANLFMEARAARHAEVSL